MMRAPIYALCAAGWMLWMAFFFGVPVGVAVWLASLTTWDDGQMWFWLSALGGIMVIGAWSGLMVGIGQYVAEHYSEEAAFLLFMYRKPFYLWPPPPQSFAACMCCHTPNDCAIAGKCCEPRVA